MSSDLMHFDFSFRCRALIFAAFALASCGTVPKTSIVAIPEGAPLAAVDDSLYAHVLARAVSPNGAVSYKELQSDTELTDYLREIALVRTDAFNSRSQTLAFWTNTHNAYVLDMLRSNMPIRSIDDISGFRFAKVVLVGGERFSLDDIEHTIVEKHFREPRAFFALFDGARSSPVLLGVPYSESHFSEQLDAQLKNFLADSTKNYLDRRANTLYLSTVYQNYASDLEDAAGGSLANFVRNFAPPLIAEWIGGHPNLRISYLSYDNTINTSDIEPPHEQIHKPAPARRPSGGIR